MAAPKTDFDFKVQTVKWFGILSGVVIISMIALGFLSLHRIVELSRAYESNLDFGPVLTRAALEPEVIPLGLEHDGLGMRNKRGVAALYMRSYFQFLATITGTVLALLGAVFVLARVDSVEVKNEVGWGNVKWLLTSSSPGIVTTIIGTLLIGSVVYLGSNSISVIDGPIFSKATSGTARTEMEIGRDRAMLSENFKAQMKRTIEKANTGKPSEGVSE